LEFALNALYKGLLVSSVLLGAMLGAAMCIFFSEKIGRRRSLLSSNIFYISGALGMAFAPSLLFLIGARFVAGIGVGISSSEVNKYISELAPSHLRGYFGGVAPLAVTSGILSSYLLGLALSSVPYNWRWMLGAAVVPSVLMLLLQNFLPESPKWLISQSLRSGRLLDSDTEARTTMERMFVPSPESKAFVDTEIQVMKESILQTLKEKDVSAHSDNGSVISTRSKGRTAITFWHALLIGVGINVLQQGAGVNVVIYYSAVILKEGGFADTGVCCCVPLQSRFLLSALQAAV
jgi:MFS family permease